MFNGTANETLSRKTDNITVCLSVNSILSFNGTFLTPEGYRTLAEEMAISLVAFVLHLIVFLLWQLVVLLS